MRWLAALAFVASCSKARDERPGTVAGTAPPTSVDATIADAGGSADAPGLDAAPAVELLRAVPTTVRVSSTVANQKIRPEHLVDRDLATAWNSITGEMVGAWIEVTVPPGVEITELRMTAGHTGRGPRGEDYFVMNPRIRAVEVLAGDAVLVRAPLDVAERGLQAVAVDASGTIRVRIAAVEPGTKKQWREVAVSELEVWGALAPGTSAGTHRPTIEVGAPEAENGAVDLAAICQAFLAEHEPRYAAATKASEQSRRACRRDARAQGRSPDECDTDDELSPPECGATTAAGALAAPWRSVELLREAESAAHGPKHCRLAVTLASGDVFFVHEGHACGPWDGGPMEVDDVTVEDVVPDGALEVVIRYTAGGEDGGARLIVCQTATTGLTCTAPLELSGADWKVGARFVRGAVVFETLTGTPPAERLGSHPLTFD